MKSAITEKISLLTRFISLGMMLVFAHSAHADYYVVYSDVEYIAPPPPTVIYQTECVVKHKKPRVHHKVRHHTSCGTVHRKSSMSMGVYYVFTPQCASFGQCGGCNGCSQQVWMPVADSCGSRVFYGSAPLRHSDSYYMQGFSEDDPDYDGNTGDNDIYY